jgi:hypothetical protein
MARDVYAAEPWDWGFEHGIDRYQWWAMVFMIKTETIEDGLGIRRSDDSLGGTRKDSWSAIVVV